MPKKKIILVILIFFVLVFAGYWGWKKIQSQKDSKEDSRAVYEVLVNIVDQKVSDPAEDARASLKKGDAIAVFPEGHAWSETEKASYLIVKIKAEKEEVDKLLEAETKERKVQVGDTEPTMSDAPEMETVRARKYHIDMGEIDAENIKVNDLLKGQPLKDKVFDEGVIEEK